MENLKRIFRQLENVEENIKHPRMESAAEKKNCRDGLTREILSKTSGFKRFARRVGSVLKERDGLNNWRGDSSKA